jgi:acid-sensing ion channel, other
MTLFLQLKISYQLPHEVPSIYVAKIAIGESVSLVLDPSIMTIAEELRKYPISERQCYLSNERPLKYFSEYSKGNCEIECEVDLILKQCGCYQIFIEGKRLNW